jgi:putative DNA primase/helicase
MASSREGQDMTNDLDRAREALSYVPAHDRDIWLRMGMALKSEFGDAAYDVWESWSQQDESFNERDAQAVWKSIRADGKVSIGTLFHESKKHGWPGDGACRKATPEELAERRRQDAERSAREEEEIARERANAREKAAAIMKVAIKARADHPYLSRKQVSPVSTLREIDAGQAAGILGYVPKSKDDPLIGRLLVVPVKQGDVFSTLELIDEGGRKAALAGRGSKAGGYWATERLPDGDGSGSTLLIGEGVATVLSVREASGYPAIAALSSSNLQAAAESIRKLYPAAKLVILADLVKASGEPDSHAIAAARTVGGRLAVPDFGSGRPEGATDFNDLSVMHGPGAVRVCVEGAKATDAITPSNTPGEAPEVSAPESDDERIARLSQLSVMEYERVRVAEAKRMGMRTSTLDNVVARERQRSERGEGIGFDDVVPWPRPVAGDALLTEIAASIARFIVCKPETARAAALWIAMSWLIDTVQVAPLAVITAPEKRCGKSQLLAILGKLSRRPMVASNISSAALFRVIDAWQPTLMIDEADAFMRENEELRGILNSGHTRDSAYVVRTVGEDFTPKQFLTWGAKALAGIGSLADTLMDRAIVLDLRRKLPHENVDRLRHAETGLFSMLATKLARWADDNREQVRQARPDLPAQLNDRAQDNWEPLLAIADVAGGSWPGMARQAALTISRGREGNLMLGAELLVDIRSVFEEKRAERISTADLIAALIEDDEGPWATYNRGRPISPRQISKRLRDYGIASKNIRVDYAVTKGFEYSQFQDAFLRYLPPPEIIRYAAIKSTESGDSMDFSVADSQNACATNNHVSATPLHRGSGDGNVSGVADVADKNGCSGYENSSATRNPSNGKGCSVVADKRGVPGDEDVIEVTI